MCHRLFNVFCNSCFYNSIFIWWMFLFRFFLYLKHITNLTSCWEVNWILLKPLNYANCLINPIADHHWVRISIFEFNIKHTCIVTNTWTKIFLKIIWSNFQALYFGRFSSSNFYLFLLLYFLWHVRDFRKLDFFIGDFGAKQGSCAKYGNILNGKKCTFGTATISNTKIWSKMW